MTNWFISVLLLKGIITQDEAEKLADDLPKHTHPQDFKAAHAVVTKILSK